MKPEQPIVLYLDENPTSCIFAVGRQIVNIPLLGQDLFYQDIIDLESRKF